MTTNSMSGSPTNTSRLYQLKSSFGRATPRIREFIINAILQVRIWDKTYAGIMHVLLFTGVTIQVIGTIINLTQMALFIPFLELPFPRGIGYLIFELVMDLAGVAIIIGVIMALVRRLVIRPKTLESRWDDYYALILLGLIPLIGFTVEGARLLIANPVWAPWSPVGNQVANLLETMGITTTTAASLHRFLFFAHVLLGLVLVVSIPFTKMRHLIYIPLNILYKPNRESSILETIENIEEVDILGVGKVSEFTSSQLLSFDACVSCGRCEEVCPVAFSGMPYSPRTFIQNLRQAMLTNLVSPNGNGRQDGELLSTSIPEETPWYCTTCGACLDRCPAFVNPVDGIVDLRRYQVLTSGKMPKSVGDVMRNMERQGNPWGMPPEDRISWTEGLDVRELGPGDETDILFFFGCAYAYDDRNKKVAQSIVCLMKSAGVEFGVLGLDEMCCGETARRLGHEYLFQMLVEQNMETFGSIKFNRLVTACPHCFNTLRNEYPQFGALYQVQHLSEFLAELPLTNKNKTIEQPDKNGKLTFHDSCYLGRYNQIYKQPRALLARAEIVPLEMSRRGSESFCCGGGGGQMWMETDANTRINHRRLNDALEIGAEVVATACPYCLLMFDDAIRSKGLGDQIQVMDVAEVLTDKLDL